MTSIEIVVDSVLTAGELGQKLVIGADQFAQAVIGKPAVEYPKHIGTTGGQVTNITNFEVGDSGKGILTSRSAGPSTEIYSAIDGVELDPDASLLTIHNCFYRTSVHIDPELARSLGSPRAAPSPQE